MWAEIDTFRRTSGIDSPSEAIRVLVEKGLRDYKALDEAFRKAAWQEGVRSSAHKLRLKIDEAVRETLGAPREKT